MAHSTSEAMTTLGPGTVRQVPGQDPRAEGVPGDDQQERTGGEQVGPAHVETDEGGHADQARGRGPASPPPVEAVRSR